MSNSQSYYGPLFEHMANEHGLTLLDSELNEIVHIVMEMQRVAMMTVIAPDTTDAVSRAMMPAEKEHTDTERKAGG
jgi:hypothetical protein